MKLFVNNLHLGFGEAEDTPATQSFSLTPKENNIVGDDKNVVIPVKFVKFQNVSDLVVFVNENFGNDDVSELKCLDIFGCAAEDSNIKNWKPVKG